MCSTKVSPFCCPIQEPIYAAPTAPASFTSENDKFAITEALTSRTLLMRIQPPAAIADQGHRAAVGVPCGGAVEPHPVGGEPSDRAS